MPAFYDHQAAPFTFCGSSEKIAQDKAAVSEFRRQHGMDPNPHGPIVGSPEEVDRKLALLRGFKSKL